MEEVEIEINKDGSVLISQYDKWELKTNVCVLTPHQAKMFALEYLEQQGV